MTEYLVLAQLHDLHVVSGGTDVRGWSEMKTVEASSASQAVRKVAGENPGSYVAVPARSFQPVRVDVEKTVKVTLSTDPAEPQTTIEQMITEDDGA